MREGVGQDTEWDNKREERRAYIESGVRRVVGKGGADGAEVGGERRAREEVEGLEDVVKGLGRE